MKTAAKEPGASRTRMPRSVSRSAWIAIVVLTAWMPAGPVLAQDEPSLLPDIAPQPSTPPEPSTAPMMTDPSVVSPPHRRQHAVPRKARRVEAAPARLRPRAVIQHRIAHPKVPQHARLTRGNQRARKSIQHPVDQLKVAERAGFKKVSDLVAFPPFFPGLGIVMVKPETLPVGPFRTFDRKDRLIASVYMLPLKDMDEHKKWDPVEGLPAPADHSTFYFHPGHPGVAMPHYHLVIWHVSRKDEDLVAK